MPLICIVRGLKKKTYFHLDMIDRYKLEAIGGNHRKLAMVELCKEDPVKFSCVESIYAGIFSVNVIPVIMWSRGSGEKFDDQNLQCKG